MRGGEEGRRRGAEEQRSTRGAEDVVHAHRSGALLNEPLELVRVALRGGEVEYGGGEGGEQQQEDGGLEDVGEDEEEELARRDADVGCARRRRRERRRRRIRRLVVCVGAHMRLEDVLAVPLLLGAERVRGVGGIEADGDNDGLPAVVADPKHAAVVG